MDVAMICHEMHWTFQEYWEQPQWLIDTLRIKLEEDSRYQKERTPKARK